MDHIDGYLSTSEAAKQLGISRQRLAKLIRQGRLPSVTLSPRLHLIPEAAIASFARNPPGRPRKSAETV